MKNKIYFTLLLAGLTLLGFSQSQRLVLLEHFTQASCGPCATYNPSISNMLNANPDKFTAIMYHTSWPGIDPMYNHNTSENGARTSYYSVSSVPNSVIDGIIYNGHPSGWNINTVNNRYDEPSPANIYIHHELTQNDELFNVNVLVEATENIPAGMKLHLAVIEKHVHFSSPPGSNGETDFDHVMKKLLPNQSGTTLPAMTTGDYMIIQQSWAHQNVYDIDELAVVGFIQNNASKEVLQAANSSDMMLTPMFSNDVEITAVKNVSLYNCDGKIHPVIEIRNNGSAEITSIDIEYKVNEEETVTFQWSGSLSFLESEEITLPESTFGVLDMNMLEIIAENPNGQADEYQGNNVLLTEIEKALLGEPAMTLYMILDDNPEETTWEVTNYEGDVIHSGGPYSDPGATILEQLDFVSTNCYTFTIYDAGGDGLSQGGSLAFGFGSTYLLNTIHFGYKDQTQFRIEFTNIAEKNVLDDLNVYPNPASETIHLDLYLFENEKVEISVMNILGEEVDKLFEGNQAPGKNSHSFDLSYLNSGMYYFLVKAGRESSTEKFVITK